MKTFTAPRPDYHPVEFLRAGGQQGKDSRPVENLRTDPSSRRANGRIFGTTEDPPVRRKNRSMCLLSVLYELFTEGLSLREDTDQLLQGLYNNDAAIPSPPDHPIGKGIRQCGTISLKLFTAALQWVLKSLDWEERGIRVDGRSPSNLRFADDIVLFSNSITEAETMLKELNEVGKKIGLRINRKKIQFRMNAFCEDAEMEFEGTPIMKTSSYVYLGRSMNIENNLRGKLNRR
ncbi:unnamed protein product [Cylicocyclus nassatus]|uniref:Reverse transcriptase domain-containing protein n=1 Tax=Cylicocyclus nassatus TaxID=53992 RepID=A0AA36M1N8_CYLNA|nr:unnamed protein product [Cylicocyclus nassatus]